MLKRRVQYPAILINFREYFENSAKPGDFNYGL